MRRLLRHFSKNLTKDMSLRDADGIGLVSDAVQVVPVIRTKYRVANCQSTGKERPHNEDTLFTLNTWLGSLDAPANFGLYLIADGMGGHQSGELASNLAAQGIYQYLLTHVYQRALFERKIFTSTELIECLQKAVEEAQALVLQRVPGGGTTLTFVMALGDDLYSVHVGDSRLYLLRTDGSLVLRTRDHSLVKRLVDLGEISEDEAGSHPYRNVLYRALGQTDPFEPDIDAFTMETGERLLICSDGLWGVLDHDSIHRIMYKDKDLDVAAIGLVEAANDAGGPDNISVILVERLA